MKNKLLLTVLAAVFTVSLVIFCFNMPQLFSSYEYEVTSTFDLNEEKTEYESYDIINALKSGCEYYRGDISEENRLFAREAVEKEAIEVLTLVFSDMEEVDIKFHEMVPFRTADGRNIWICSCKTEKYNRDFFALFDEATGKFISYEEDRVTASGDAYEDIYERNYKPDDKELEEAFMKVEIMVSKAADYYKLQVGQVWFEYSLGNKFIFKAELYDSDGEAVTVNVSYNMYFDLYNFNY